MTPEPTTPSKARRRPTERPATHAGESTFHPCAHNCSRPPRLATSGPPTCPREQAVPICGRQLTAYTPSQAVARRSKLAFFHKVLKWNRAQHWPEGESCPRHHICCATPICTAWHCRGARFLAPPHLQALQMLGAESPNIDSGSDSSGSCPVKSPWTPARRVFQPLQAPISQVQPSCCLGPRLSPPRGSLRLFRSLTAIEKTYVAQLIQLVTVLLGNAGGAWSQISSAQTSAAGVRTISLGSESYQAESRTGCRHYVPFSPPFFLGRQIFTRGAREKANENTAPSRDPTTTSATSRREL